MRKTDKTQKGITLIETVIYLGLLTLIIGSGTVAAYDIINSSEAIRSRTIVQEEGNFLLGKIDWALTGLSAVDVPAPSTSSSLLSVDKITAAPNPIIINVSSGHAQLQRGSAPATVLTNDDVVVQNLNFSRFTNPDGVKASFTMQGILFETTRYIRK